MPVAATMKVAVCPEVAVWLTGCVVMAGGKFTVSVAALLVTVPVLFVTATENKPPLSAAAVAGVV